MKTFLRQYIKEFKGITITDAAKQLGCSRGRLSGICNGLPAGRALAKKIQDWSCQAIKARDLMQID